MRLFKATIVFTFILFEHMMVLLWLCSYPRGEGRVAHLGSLCTHDILASWSPWPLSLLSVHRGIATPWLLIPFQGHEELHIRFLGLGQGHG